LLGNALPERVAGADLVPIVIELAARKKYRLFLLGATQEASDRAVANLLREYPELIIAGHYSPPFNKLLEMDHEEIRRRIVAAGPDLLLTSFGCPKQEKWIAMHYRALGVPVAMGVGATIDFLAGQVKRAPRWMQKSGTEWIFRLAQEPRRLFRRYLTDVGVFSVCIFQQWWRLQFRSRTSASVRAKSHEERRGDWLLISLPERLDLQAVRTPPYLEQQALAEGKHCLLAADGVTFIDSTGIGQLIRLQKKLNELGRQLVLVNPSKSIERALSLMKLREFFVSAPDVDSAQTLIEARCAENQPVAWLAGPVVSSIKWRGEITAANAEEVWHTTEKKLLGLPAGTQLRIDLSEVRFIDSSGLGIMVRVRKLARHNGVHLMFSSLQAAVRNVIHLARLEDFLLNGGAANAEGSTGLSEPNRAAG
jgi:N-acetylglucosaminyldiphosphoundecaprenol N-acetyl-beta-D-mannosaminyltransferase